MGAPESAQDSKRGSIQLQHDFSYIFLKFVKEKCSFEKGQNILEIAFQIKFEMTFVGIHLRAPALKTENFKKQIGRFSITQNWIY